MERWSYKIAWTHYHGELYNHPWWEHILSENSPPYEDSRPTHTHYRIDPLKPLSCPKCGALLLRDDCDIACWMCGWRDSFHYDTIILAQIARFWESVKKWGNQDVLLSIEEQRLREYSRQWMRKKYLAIKGDDSQYQRALEKNRLQYAKHREERRAKRMIKYYANHEYNKVEQREMAKQRRIKQQAGA